MRIAFRNFGVRRRVRLCIVNLMFLRAFSVFTFSVLVAAAHARLGDTEGQSQQRYGQPRDDLAGPNEKPLMEGSIEKAYEFQGWRIRQAFVNGACARIEYAHLPDGAVPKPMTDSEAKAIIEAEKGKFSWREEKATKQPGAAGEIEKALKGAFNVKKWERSDHAKAEMALGLVLKLQIKDADDLAKKLAKQAQEKGKKPAGAPNLPKF